MTLAINTARRAPTMHGMSEHLRTELADVPFCYRQPGEDPRDSKVRCMREIKDSLRFQGSDTSVILVDDRPENCAAVRRKGFSCLQINPDGRGIDDRIHTTALSLLSFIK